MPRRDHLLFAALALIASGMGAACDESTPDRRIAPARTAQQTQAAQQGPASSSSEDRREESSAEDKPAPQAGLSYPAIEPADPARGKELVERFECNRCHAETGGPAATRAKDCVGCHDDIIEGRFPAPAPALARWRKTSDPYTVTPSLLGVGKRLRRDWLVGFFQKPVDLRPKLAASMPRLNLTEQDARDLAAYVTRDAPDSAAGPALQGDVARGRKLVDEKACGSCHAFSGASGFSATFTQGDERQKRAIRLAPDLRFTRQRFVRQRLVQWLLNPVEVKSDSLMPNHGLSKGQAADVAAYLYETPVSAYELPPPPARLPVLERRVSYEEVDEKVFHITCRHCHSDPDAAMGDGGPGNTGGFGFAPKKLDLATYKGVAAGYIDAKGERQSVFAPMADGVPRLVAALLARQREEAGTHSDEIRGMPLGLPALTPEQIQLVESWVAQGRPR